MVGVADAVPGSTATKDGKTKDEKKPEGLKKVVGWLWQGAKAFWKAARAFAFVVAGFAFWYLFVSLAKFVMRCELVAWRSWLPESKCVPIELGSYTQLTGTYVIILVTTLVVAIWAAKRLVFPPDD